MLRLRVSKREATSTEMGIYKRQILRENVRKKSDWRKKERKHNLDQEKKARMAKKKKRK